MGTDTTTDRQALLATIARWNIEGRLDGVVSALSDAQLRDLLAALDAVYQLGYETAREDLGLGVNPAHDQR